MQTGKLYKATKNNLWWLVVQTQEAYKEILQVAAESNTPFHAFCNKLDSLVNAKGYATYWSYELKCSVTYLNPDDIFMLLDHANDFYFKILAPNGNIGWIFVPPDQLSWFSEQIKTT